MRYSNGRGPRARPEFIASFCALAPAGVEADALRFAFEIVTQETAAAGAELMVEPVAVRAYCSGCAADFAPEDAFVFSCPKCGQLSWDIRQGRELELMRIEVS